jgi:hypothetical protein
VKKKPFESCLDKRIWTEFLRLDEALSVVTRYKNLQLQIVDQSLETGLSIFDVLDKLIVQDKGKMFGLVRNFDNSGILIKKVSTLKSNIKQKKLSN